MPELAYRHPKRGKVHRADGLQPFHLCIRPVCRSTLLDELTALAVPVEQVDPADLCKRCWPGRTP